MSTDDDRPGAAGGYSDSGLFTPSNDPYANRGFTGGSAPGDTTSGDSGAFDESGYTSGPTTMLPGSSPFEEDDATEVADERKARWHGGADLGLLALRLVVGVLFIAHGLQKLFGWFNGDGINGTADLLAGFGYQETTILAWVTGVTELTGGVLLVVGLFTPIGAAAILGVMANVIVVKADIGVFAANVELESVYAAAAFALLFAGAGRISLDRPTHWYRFAPAYGFVFLLVSAGAAATMLLVFR